MADDRYDRHDPTETPAEIRDHAYTDSEGRTPAPRREDAYSDGSTHGATQTGPSRTPTAFAPRRSTAFSTTSTPCGAFCDGDH